MAKIQTTRIHEICIAHRLPNHSGKCKNLHGHNITIELTVESNQLNTQGMVMDFGDIKKIFIEWLENYWDHKTLLYVHDPIIDNLTEILPEGSVLPVAFIPTSENLAQYLLEKKGPALLKNTNCTLTKIKFYETSKCFTEVSLNNLSQELRKELCCRTSSGGK